MSRVLVNPDAKVWDVARAARIRGYTLAWSGRRFVLRRLEVERPKPIMRRGPLRSHSPHSRPRWLCLRTRGRPKRPSIRLGT